jgi:hypothetical protein
MKFDQLSNVYEQEEKEHIRLQSEWRKERVCLINSHNDDDDAMR